MQPVVHAALVLLAFVGHFALAVWLFNRLHAIAWPVKTIKRLEKLLLLVAAVVCLAFAGRWLLTGAGLLPSSLPASEVQLLWFAYACVAWAAALAVVPLWLLPKLLERTPAALASNHTHVVDVVERLGFAPLYGGEARLLARIPGNEILRIAVQEKVLRWPRLPEQLAGLKIAHLSDLHMTGRIGREFYDVAVDQTNRLDPDFVVITGDILEKECCLDWIAPTLGRLTARHGKYFILGNHEKRLADAAPLRAALVAAGFADLGGCCEIQAINGTNVLLAGSELPWFGKAPEVRCSSDSTFRILLSHSPDQLPWAKEHAFDLMLAGHNHGGQIRLPFLGALIAPSRFGWRYAGGLYHEEPTLLHVSRGLSGIHPIRLNCPPEIALLVLSRE
jgi:hypothetical protein